VSCHQPTRFYCWIIPKTQRRICELGLVKVGFGGVPEEPGLLAGLAEMVC
jgi:hypothetical protein